MRLASVIRDRIRFPNAQGGISPQKPDCRSISSYCQSWSHSLSPGHKNVRCDEVFLITLLTKPLLAKDEHPMAFPPEMLSIRENAFHP